MSLAVDEDFNIKHTDVKRTLQLKDESVVSISIPLSRKLAVMRMSGSWRLKGWPWSWSRRKKAVDTEAETRVSAAS